jgi:hypothetical protein
MSELHLPRAERASLWRHLDPRGSATEAAAFVVARCTERPSGLELQWLETLALHAEDFAWRLSDYIELTDEARVSLIKRAHQLEGSLIELHSHLGLWPAAFSLADMQGFSETVPHMLWRLPGRPYAAIVVASSGFDALVWQHAGQPIPLRAIVCGEREFLPTNLSWEALQ